MASVVPPYKLSKLKTPKLEAITITHKPGHIHTFAYPLMPFAAESHAFVGRHDDPRILPPPNISHAADPSLPERVTMFRFDRNAVVNPRLFKPPLST